MVSIEPQRTHMSFDGLCDVFGALSAKLIARKVEGRQRPISAAPTSTSSASSTTTAPTAPANQQPAKATNANSITNSANQHQQRQPTPARANRTIDGRWAGG